MSAAVLVYTLRNNATIGAAIGNARAYPVDYVPKGADRPFITYQCISNRPEKDLAGNTVGTEAEYNLEIVADTAASVRTILDALDSAFSSLGGTTVAGVAVQAAEGSDSGDEVSGPLDLNDGQGFLGSATVGIYYGG